MNTMNAILARASYKGKYMDTIVPRSDLKKIIEVGLAANLIDMGLFDVKQFKFTSVEA